MKQRRCIACETPIGHFASVYGVRTERRLSRHEDIRSEHLVNATRDRGVSPTDKRTASKRGTFVAGGALVKVVRKFHRKLTGEFCIKCARTDKDYRFAPRDAMVGTVPTETDGKAVKGHKAGRESDRIRPHVAKHIGALEENVVLDVPCECCHVAKTSATCNQCGRYICTAKGCRVVVDGFKLCRECDTVTYAPDLGTYAVRGSRQVVVRDLDAHGGKRDTKAAIVVWAGKPIDENILGHRQCYAVPFLHHYRATGGKPIDVVAHVPMLSPDAFERRGEDMGQARNRRDTLEARRDRQTVCPLYYVRDRQGRVVAVTPFDSVGH